MNNVIYYEPITDFSTLKLNDYVVVEDLSEPSNFSLKKLVNNIKTIKVTDLIGPAAGLKILGKSTGSTEITNAAKAINVTTGVIGATAVAGALVGPAAAAGLAGTAAKTFLPAKTDINPGAQYDIPIPQADTTATFIQQQIAQQQKLKAEEEAAAIAEAEKKKQMQNFIALGAVGVLIVVAVMVFVKK